MPCPCLRTPLLQGWRLHGVVQTQRLAFPGHGNPTAVGPSTHGPRWPHCPPGLLPIASLYGALPASQTAKQAHTLLPWNSLPCNPCCPNHVSHLAVCPYLGPGHCSSGSSPWLCCSKPYVLGWEWPPAVLRTWDLPVGLLICLTIYQPSLHTGLYWFLETSYM